VRSFAFYSHKARGRRARAGRHQNHVVDNQDDHIPRHVARRRWAALIRRIWQVDPLTCPRCGGRMKIVSFISPTQRHVIDKILTHCGLGEQPSRAPPCKPDPARLRYVSDLESVDEPAPAEPVWTTD
jgi:hypothetical protein